MAKSHRQYYVSLSSFWQDAPKKLVGPFATRQQADTAISLAQSKEDNLVSRSGYTAQHQDAKRAIYVRGIYTKTQVLRLGYSLDDCDQLITIGMEVPINTDELFEMENR